LVDGIEVPEECDGTELRKRDCEKGEVFDKLSAEDSVIFEEVRDLVELIDISDIPAPTAHRPPIQIRQRRKYEESQDDITTVARWD